MAMHYRLALFLCGDLSGDALAQNGGYRDIYTRYLTATCPAHLQPFTLDAYDVREGQYPSADQADTYHAIILTGSAANAYDSIEWIDKLVAYIKRVASSKPHIKLIGICFGHQIIARALGGQCVPNDGRWEVGPTQIALTPLGKRIFGARDTLTIQEMHRDHVPSESLPAESNLQIIASSEVSPNQGMVQFYPPSSNSNSNSSSDSSASPSSFSSPPTQTPSSNTQTPSTEGKIHILTIQGHPEFTQPIVASIVAQRSAAGVMGPSISASLQERVERGWDEKAQRDSVGLVGEVLWGVVEGRV